MTQYTIYQEKADRFINTVIKESTLTYDELMKHLAFKIEDWSSELHKLNLINIFELSDDEYRRKNYLASLIICGNAKIIDNRSRKLHLA